jgi:hypothetical protein
VLADSPEDFERCLVGRAHFLREQLFTAVGEIKPERHEHTPESRQTWAGPPLGRRFWLAFGIALFPGALAGSVALVGFGVDSLIEFAAPA